MRGKLSLTLQVFASIVGVALVTALAVGYFARTALATAFDAYLSSMPLPGSGGRPRMGRAMLGAAEQTFVASVDQSVFLAAALAVAVATVIAIVLATYLSRPLRKLETAAEQLAEGDLTHRVDVAGPSEVAALGDAFNRMADSLEEAEALRRRLVADVAHELRNPIAAARLQAEGMAEGVLTASPDRLASMLADLKHLSVLVDDLHELSVAESGRLTYHPESFDLASLVNDEVARAAGLADATVAVVSEGATEGLAVVADTHRTSQVLRNLLSNAIRHTHDGSIVVKLERTQGFARITVTDTGDGIPAADLPHIFERFFRADTARAADTGGAGLGLAITRTLVRDMGGDVFADSTEGEGSAIGFTLPLSLDATPS